MMDEKNYSNDFTEDSLWEKLRRVARGVGREIVEKVLMMFFAVQDPDTPLWARTILVAALGYFICPVDAIPDLIPGAGYADDAGAIATALGTVAMHIKPEHRERAKAKASEWFA